MAGGQERVLRRRIKSIDATKKITRAMELIAATRVVKAQERAWAARPYAQEITAVITDLVKAGAAKDHPLLRRNDDAKTVCLVVVTSDRGLCGAYNSSVIRLAERELKERRAEGLNVSLVVIGRKAETYFRFRGYAMDATISGVTDRPTYDHARQVAQAFRSRYADGELASVALVYTAYRSAGVQEAVIRRFLPLNVEGGSGHDGPTADLEYEPSPTGILNSLLPRYVESRVFSALLDASASEHAARQRAMKAATDNAEELKINLTRQMNRARQDAITTEIMEIVGGAEALKADKVGDEELLPSLLVPEHLFAQKLDATDPAHSAH